MGVQCQERESKERKRKKKERYSARRDERGLDSNSTTMINLRKKVISSLKEKKEKMSKGREQG